MTHWNQSVDLIKSFRMPNPIAAHLRNNRRQRQESEIAHFINNTQVLGKSGRSQDVFNPMTGIAEKAIALASAAEVNLAVAAAKAAFPAWSKMPSLWVWGQRCYPTGSLTKTSEGRLVDVFPTFQVAATTSETGVWALYPSRSFLPTKVRVAIDFLRQQLRTSDHRKPARNKSDAL